MGIHRPVNKCNIVSFVIVDLYADPYFFFSPPKKNNAIPTIMDRGPCLTKHIPLRRSKIDESITPKLSTQKKPKGWAPMGSACMFCLFAENASIHFPQALNQIFDKSLGESELTRFYIVKFEIQNIDLCSTI